MILALRAGRVGGGERRVVAIPCCRALIKCRYGRMPALHRALDRLFRLRERAPHYYTPALCLGNRVSEKSSNEPEIQTAGKMQAETGPVPKPALPFALTTWASLLHLPPRAAVRHGQGGAGSVPPCEGNDTGLLP